MKKLRLYIASLALTTQINGAFAAGELFTIDTDRLPQALEVLAESPFGEELQYQAERAERKVLGGEDRKKAKCEAIKRIANNFRKPGTYFNFAQQAPNVDAYLDHGVAYLHGNYGEVEAAEKIDAFQMQIFQKFDEIDYHSDVYEAFRLERGRFNLDPFKAMIYRILGVNLHEYGSEEEADPATEEQRSQAFDALKGCGFLRTDLVVPAYNPATALARASEAHPDYHELILGCGHFPAAWGRLADNLYGAIDHIQEVECGMCEQAPHDHAITLANKPAYQADVLADMLNPALYAELPVGRFQRVANHTLAISFDPERGDIAPETSKAVLGQIHRILAEGGVFEIDLVREDLSAVTIAFIRESGFAAPERIERDDFHTFRFRKQ